MKRLMAAATAITLLAGTTALADPPGRDHGAAPGGGGHGDGGHGDGPPGGGHGPGSGPGPGAGASRPHAYVPSGRGDIPHPKGGSAPPGAEPATHQGRAHERYDWRGARAWQDQPDYYDRRWAYGDYLPDGWFAGDFWIGDYDDYDLPAPPYGYEWVRSGPDALLVDVYTGEVAEAVYGVF